MNELLVPVSYDCHTRARMCSLQYAHAHLLTLPGPDPARGPIIPRAHCASIKTHYVIRNSLNFCQLRMFACSARELARALLRLSCTIKDGGLGREQTGAEHGDATQEQARNTATARRW